MSVSFTIFNRNTLTPTKSQKPALNFGSNIESTDSTELTAIPVSTDSNEQLPAETHKESAISRHASLLTMVTGALAFAGGIGCWIAGHQVRPQNLSPEAIKKCVDLALKLRKAGAGAGIPGAVLGGGGFSSWISSIRKPRTTASDDNTAG